ncbi:MAG TPA: ADP-ribosylglycohydrolase family protein, partial [Parafilimonas sp.]|nr:ADP-ribosylglycohydrolase family protein [Parafilimonas sp.]
NEALKTIPQLSEFYQCVHDAVEWHKQFPNDWKQTWFHIQKKWANDVGCPEGVFKPFDIDAKVNAAYVVTGLLYGGGDYTKTLEITARCGQDADCNPSTVGGILGALLGYNKIPAYWKQGLKESEDIDFKYTTMSLNDVYNIGFKHALENIKRNGGSVDGDEVTIKTQTPMTVKFEKSFDGLYPVAEIPVDWNDKKDVISFNYEGTGFVLRGETANGDNTDFVFHTELYVDGKLVEKPELPASFTTRRCELCWNYDLPKGKHEVQLKILNPSSEHNIDNVSAIYYTDKPIDGMRENEEEAKTLPQ